MRVFFAIEPPRELRAKLAALSARLAKKQFRATATDQLHITLRFFGTASESDVDTMTKAAAAVCAQTKPFELAIAGAGSFGKRNVPHVVWAGVVDESGALARFARDFDDAFARVGFARDEREASFRPHITIARLNNANPRARAVRFDPASLDVDCGGFRVDELVLFSSTTTSSRAVHTELARFHFG